MVLIGQTALGASNVETKGWNSISQGAEVAWILIFDTEYLKSYVPAAGPT